MFSNHNVMTVYYEELVSDMDRGFGKLTQFLNVPFISPKTTMKKQNPEPFENLVENYHELKSVFSGSEWEIFFE